MKIASISKFRKEIRRFVDEIDQNQEPLVVTRSDNVSVVVLPLDMFNSYAETDYLLRSPANAARLRQALEKLRSDQITARKLIEKS